MARYGAKRRRAAATRETLGETVGGAEEMSGLNQLVSIIAVNGFIGARAVVIGEGPPGGTRAKPARQVRRPG